MTLSASAPTACPECGNPLADPTTPCPTCRVGQAGPVSGWPWLVAGGVLAVLAFAAGALLWWPARSSPPAATQLAREPAAPAPLPPPPAPPPAAAAAPEELPAPAPPPRRDWPYTLVIVDVQAKPTKANGKPWDLPPFERPDLYVVVTRRDPARQDQYRRLQGQIGPLRQLQANDQQLAQMQRQRDALKADDPRRAALEQRLRRAAGQGMRRMTAGERARLSELEQKARAVLAQYEYRAPVVQDSYRAVYNAAALGVDEGDEVTVRVMDSDLLVDDLVGQETFTITRRHLAEGGRDWSFGQVARLRLRFRAEKR